MKRRKRGYGILLALTILLALATIATAIPQPSASSASMLGYKAHCTFTPASTLLCIVATGIVCAVRKRKFIEVAPLSGPGQNPSP
jgi:hypothetical protein